jgi:uncharacterized protein
MPAIDILLAALILGAALLYSSVGHGGASGYLAVMALAALSPAVMKPTALGLNILVASIATARYVRAGAFSWPLFWRLAAASIPFAYLGGATTLPGHVYKPLVGAVLVFAAWRSIHTARHLTPTIDARPHWAVLLLAGATLGFLSGITGVGGGIFLSPLLLLLHWAQVKVISGTAAAFIFVNSVAGLLGVAGFAPELPAALPYWAVAAAIGGLVGAEYGSRHLRNSTVRKLLAVVLAIAGLKMMVVA